uniref:Uncharacterized protein n=1 Tax=Avena sativa TaxID=4498 RepID=A0ACD5YDQ6_AVESA
MTADEQPQSLMTALSEITLQMDGTGDTRSMSITGKPPRAKDYYNIFLEHGTVWSPAKWIWLKPIPHRHKVFLWLAYRGRLNMRSNMVTKKWCTDSGCDQCPAVETFEHIALHCTQASWIWEKLGINHTVRRENELLALHRVRIQGDTETWSICVAACLLSLWYARNDRIFNQNMTNRSTLLANIASLLELWAAKISKRRDKLLIWANSIRGQHA